MTRDEYREKCLKAMEAGFWRVWRESASDIEEQLAAAFDALHGIARVVPIEVTEEMDVVRYNLEIKHPHTVRDLFEAMSAAGDLTNQPDPFGTSAEAPK